jgi:hypothetical protein
VTPARRATVAAIASLAAAAFVVLATANSGGYRFGVSDQAYYLPAIERQMDPGLFPRDRDLLDAQSQLVTSDQLLAGVMETTRATLPSTAAALYLISLLVLLAAGVAYARGLHFSWWAVAAFGLLLTLRHRIAKTGANSLEGYMHPRQLAFGLGIAALACLVRGRLVPAMSFVVLAAVLHPTTALWFGVLLACGVAVQKPEWRRGLVGLAVVATGLGIWMLTLGPLAGRLVVMDAEWLRVLAEKDYLFPTEWPLDAWLINLAYPVVIWFTWRARRTRGLDVAGEVAIAGGSAALLLLFLVSIPLTALEVALAVQLQITRVFWVLDFIALAYVAWWLTRHPRGAMAVVAALAITSTARGYYLLEVWQPERQLVTIDLPDTEWMDAMRWLKTQPSDMHVLADPGHAWKYGTSVRVGAHRDTLLESVKDSAIALYSRPIAERVAVRGRDLVDFDRLSTLRARALATQYDLDVVVVESAHVLALPELYRNARFVIYDLR